STGTVAREREHGASDGLQDREVGISIPVELADPNGGQVVEEARAREFDSRGERSVAAAERRLETRGRRIEASGEDEILDPVAVQVRDRDFRDRESRDRHRKGLDFGVKARAPLLPGGEPQASKRPGRGIEEPIFVEIRDSRGREEKRYG